ncbi:MAG: DedA family protein, partial [Castellaniella sp.]
MEFWLQSSIHTLLALFALPRVGLPAIFLVSLISATLLPMGSEPAVFAYVQIVPSMFWPAVLVATAGNTIGGAISYAMGAGAEAAWH